MKGSRKIVLAIESAILGGSVSVIVNGQETASYIGTTGTARAEELLLRIDELLTTNGIDRKDIEAIAVSAGPGSFTGIRIGIATALGLKAGLGIRIVSQSVLVAMAVDSGLRGEIATAVPLGRQAVGVQKFLAKKRGIEPVDSPGVLSEDDFIRFVKNDQQSQLVAHSSLSPFIRVSGKDALMIENLALAIGRSSIAWPDAAVPPIFLSKGN